MLPFFSLFTVVVFHAVVQKSLLFRYFSQAYSISVSHRPLCAILITLSPLFSHCISCFRCSQPLISRKLLPCYTHSPLPMKLRSTEYFLFIAASKKEGTTQEIAVLAPLQTVPCILNLEQRGAFQRAPDGGGDDYSRGRRHGGGL